MIKLAYIRKLPDGKYRVMSHSGRNMGTYDSKEAAKKRLAQIEMFKHFKNRWRRKKASNNLIVKAEKDIDFTYSAVMRHMRQNHPEQIEQFMKAFKEAFDSLDKNLSREELEEKTLLQALDSISEE